MPVRFGAGYFDCHSDGFRGHGGDRAHGGQEFDEGGVRGQSPGWPDRKKSHFQGTILMRFHLDPNWGGGGLVAMWIACWVNFIDLLGFLIILIPFLYFALFHGN